MSKIRRKKDIRFKRMFTSILVVLSILFLIAIYLVFTQSGHWLVNDDDFNHVRWVVVLDGQSADLERTDFAAQLLANGQADSVIILGRRCLRNRNNAEFYADEFMQQGSFDSSTVFLAPHDDASTIGEAYTIIPWLKKHKADTVLLVTSAAATRRVKRIFEKLSGESPIYLTTDIHHYQYNADSWYSHRESRKNWLREWLSSIACFFDLWSAGTLTEKDSSYYKPILSIQEYEQQKNPVINLQTLLPKIQEKIREVPSVDSALTAPPAESLPPKDTNP